MMFRLIFNDDAKEQFGELEDAKSKQAAFKAVCKALALMVTNLRHPS
jgi:hypothetical protein